MCGRKGGGYRQPDYSFAWVTSSLRLRWAFLEELEMENEEEQRYTPIHRDHVSRMKRPASSPHVKISIQKFVISSQ